MAHGNDTSLSDSIYNTPLVVNGKPAAVVAQEFYPDNTVILALEGGERVRVTMAQLRQFIQVASGAE